MAQTNEKYELASKEDFDSFRAAVDSTEGWRNVVDKAEVKVWDKATDSALNVVKMWASLKDIPASLAYDVLHDPDYRKDWDNNMAEGYNICVLDPYNDVGYYAGKSPFFAISGRDFCNQRSWFVSADKTEYIIMNHSVIHKDCPEKKGFVRAWSHRTGYLIRVDPKDEKSCTILYMTQTDMKGSIPYWAVNQAMKMFAPNLVSNLQRVSPGYTEWKDKHDPEKKIWLSNEPYQWEKKDKKEKEKS